MERESLLQSIGRTLRTAPPSAMFGIAVIVLYGLIAIFAPVLAPYGESEVVGGIYEPWGDGHVLGTDNIGRDMLTRLIYGARNTVGIALITTVLTFSLGSLLGLLAAVLGGWFDQIMGRFVDIMMSIPQLIFALLLLTIFKPSIASMILVIAMLESTRVFRLTRAVAMNIVVMDYVEVARLRGESFWWVIFKEVLPNASAPLIAEFGLRYGFVFLFIAALSFLGLGIQPPTADWGSMVRENAALMSYGDITPLLPAMAIALLSIGINFVVDWLLHKSSGLKDV